MQASPTELSHRYLWFSRGGTRFAVAMEQLQEVLPLSSLRPLPVSEPSLAGLMTLREFILPVFDPALLLGTGTVPAEAQANAVILSLRRRPIFAILAGKVGQVINLSQQLQPVGTARVPAAFAGRSQTADRESLFILNVPPFAALMGLAAANA